MSAIIKPISSDGGFVTAGNIEVSISTVPISSPAPYINGFSSINTTMGGNLGGFRFNANGVAIMPTGETVFRNNGDTITLESYDTPNSTSRSMRLGTNGGLYLEQIGLIPTSNRTWLTINPNAGNVEISASVGVVGDAAGGNISIAGGDAFQDVYNTSAGGDVNITGGLGASDDGGGGGPGGSINISSGASADTAGHAGNVVIQTGGSNNWTFDYTGNLTLPGNTFAVNYANGTQVSLGGGGTPNSLANSSAVFTLLSDNTLLSGTTGSPQNFKVNDAYTPDVDIRNASGTGLYTQGANMTFRTQGTYNWNFTNTGNLTTQGNITVSGSYISTPVPYANLTAIAGSRAFINNGNLVAAGNFGAQVAGGGSNTVPVWSDGTNWYIG